MKWALPLWQWSEVGNYVFYVIVIICFQAQQQTDTGIAMFHYLV